MQLNGHRLRLMYGRPLQMNTIRSDTSARDRKIETGGRVLISCDLFNKRGVWSVFHTHTTANTKYSLNQSGGQLRARCKSEPIKTERGVVPPLGCPWSMIRHINSAHFSLGFVIKTDRGVVRGLGEIKILQGRIPAPEAQLRSSAYQSCDKNARSQLRAFRIYASTSL